MAGSKRYLLTFADKELAFDDATLPGAFGNAPRFFLAPSMRDLARASTLIGYRDLVHQLGGDADRLLHRFHIEPKLLDKEESMLPYRSIMRLLEATATNLQCPDFGMLLAEQQGFDVVGPLAIIGLNSPTVGHALAAIFEHIDFYSPACLLNIDTATDPRLPRITFDTTITNEPHKRQSVELAVSLINRDIKTLTKGQFVANSVWFRHSTPLPKATYRKYFGTRVLFEQEINCVVVRPKDLQYPLENVNSYLKEIVTDYVRQSLGSHPRDIREQVSFLVRRLLPGSDCGLRKVAEHLCVHERTLQRRLKENGIVFENIVDSVRRERAEELLKDSRLSMAQIAIQLGYSEQTSLNRSCVRWFGRSPLAVRGQRASQQVIL